MKYRKLCKTGLDVSVIGLGSWVFGGEVWAEPEDSCSIAVVKSALERGVNFFDTSPVYGSGRAESVLGRALKDDRKKAVVATKCGLERKGFSIRPNLSPKFIRKDLEGSLRRLETDYVDLYQCHWPDPKTPIEHTMREMNLLKKEGKIRHIGVSNFNRAQLQEALRYAEVVSDQVHYSVLERSMEEDLLGFVSEKVVSIISYGSLGGGILTGKYSVPPSLPKKDARSFFYRFYHEPVWSRVKELLEVLKDIDGGHDPKPAKTAIRWLLGCESLCSCLVGCRTEKQLQANLEAAEGSLSNDELNAVNAAYNRIFSG